MKNGVRDSTPLEGELVRMNLSPSLWMMVGKCQLSPCPLSRGQGALIQKEQNELSFTLAPEYNFPFSDYQIPKERLGVFIFLRRTALQ